MELRWLRWSRGLNPGTAIKNQPHSGQRTTRGLAPAPSHDGFGACDGAESKLARNRPKTGVSDGDRTRDNQGHNLVLYRLSYAHQHP